MQEGKALITGASGFIGSRLRDTLLGRGVDVVAIRRKGSPPAKTGRSVTADYADVEGLAEVMAEEKPDVVFHVAGATKGRTYADFRRANVMPTENLLEALRRAHPGVKRFVHVSSLTSYGPSDPARPIDEAAPRRPIEFYGQSKLEAEQAVEREGALPWTIVRPAGVYGPGDADYFELFRSAWRRVNVFLGNEKRWMSAIYVDDCVRGILEAATHEKTAGEGYFLADPEPITWGAFQEHVVRAVGKRALKLNLPEALVTVAAHAGEAATRLDGKPRLFNKQKAKMGAQEAWTCCVDKARGDFGFETEVKPAEGTRRTHEWYRREGWY
ncbi:MAG: hypothetical protein CMN31_25845 [Sandaracinus sp.]|nr:hypothetical protein [Sandaracinus sp.]